MARKWFTAEQIIMKLREAEVGLARGKSVRQVCKLIGVPLHPVCQKELYNPGRYLSGNPDFNSNLTRSGPFPDVRLGYTPTRRLPKARPLQRGPPVPSCQEALLFNGVFLGEAYGSSSGGGLVCSG